MKCNSKLFWLSLIIATFCLIAWKHADGLPSGHDSQQHFLVACQTAFALPFDLQTLTSVLKEQPARYGPLTYLLTGALLKVGSFSYWATILSIALFWSVGLGLLFKTGQRLTNKIWLAFFPVLFALSSTTFWEIGFSYNLEASAFCGAFVIIFALVSANGNSTTLRFLFMLPAVAVFSLTKPVILIAALPFAILWAISAKKETRGKYLMITLAMTIPTIIWLLFHYQTILPELHWDFQNPIAAHPSWYLYYPKVWLIDYRGLPLTIGLIILLLIRIKTKSAGMHDLAFFALFLVPFVFFSAIDTKRLWYPLIPFLSLSLWYVYSASRLIENNWIKITNYCLVICYTLLSVINLSLVLYLAFTADHQKDYIWGIRTPKPPTPIEKKLTVFMSQELKSTPAMRAMLDLSATDISQYRFLAMALHAFPELALTKQVFPFDNTGINLDEFVTTVDKYTKLYTFYDGWPQISSDIYNKMPRTKSLAEIQSILETKKQEFALQAIVNLSKETDVHIFQNINPEKTLFKKNLLGSSSKDQFFIQPSNLKLAIEAANHALDKDDKNKAAAILRQVLLFDPKHCDARQLLAKSLSASGNTEQALEQWNMIIEGECGFGTKIETLNDIGQAQSGNQIRQGTMNRFASALEAKHADTPAQMYSILSLKLTFDQKSKQWQSAMDTISKMQKYLRPDQLQGVLLSKANILINMNEPEKAIALLESILKNTRRNHPVFGDAALLLAKVHGQKHDFKEAEKAIDLSTKGVFDSGQFANTIIFISSQMVQDNLADDALGLLEKTTTNLQAEHRALLLLEAGKIYLEKKDLEKAKQLFEKAMPLATDENLIKWLQSTIKDIDNQSI